MWYEAGVLCALSVGALLVYTGAGMWTAALVRVFGRTGGAQAHEETLRRGSKASLASALIGLGLTLVGVLTLYLVAARLRG